MADTMRRVLRLRSPHPPFRRRQYLHPPFLHLQFLRPQCHR